jgi:hypothetical protein
LKEQVDAEVQALLSLKELFKNLTLLDWKPDLNLAAQQNNSAASNEKKVKFYNCFEIEKFALLKYIILA